MDCQYNYKFIIILLTSIKVFKSVLRSDDNPFKSFKLCLVVHSIVILMLISYNYNYYSHEELTDW